MSCWANGIESLQCNINEVCRFTARLEMQVHHTVLCASPDTSRWFPHYRLVIANPHELSRDVGGSLGAVRWKISFELSKRGKCRGRIAADTSDHGENTCLICCTTDSSGGFPETREVHWASCIQSRHSPNGFGLCQCCSGSLDRCWYLQRSKCVSIVPVWFPFGTSTHRFCVVIVIGNVGLAF